MMGGRLIPIPLSWAPFFPDYPTMGVAFRCLIHLMREALPADKSHLRPFADGIALACGTLHPTAATPLSALVSRWKRVPYSKPLLAGAAVAWEWPRGTPDARTNHFDSLFGGGPQQDDQRSGSASLVGTSPVSVKRLEGPGTASPTTGTTARSTDEVLA
jgi:hypothetical protein